MITDGFNKKRDIAFATFSNDQAATVEDRLEGYRITAPRGEK